MKALAGRTVIGLLSRIGRTSETVARHAGELTFLAFRVAIATLTGRGVEGAIVGKALYAGRFTLPQALAAVGT